MVLLPEDIMNYYDNTDNLKSELQLTFKNEKALISKKLDTLLKTFIKEIERSKNQMYLKLDMRLKLYADHISLFQLKVDEFFKQANIQLTQLNH